jgi:hypothetical protein
MAKVQPNASSGDIKHSSDQTYVKILGRKIRRKRAYRGREGIEGKRKKDEHRYGYRRRSIKK